MPVDAISVTVAVTTTLEKIGVPYFIGGSLASTLYGMVRTTQDSDIIADISIEHVPRLIEALQNDFYLDDQMIVHAVAQHTSFNIIHRESMFKVVFFIPPARPFVQIQFLRARQEILSSDTQTSARVASPEDTLLAKLEWYRLGDEISDRQWRDVLGVLKVQAGALDLEYLRKWADELQLRDLLERAFEEA